MRSLRCIFGHQFGDWEYTSEHESASDSSSCLQVRICSRDGFEEKRYDHQWLSQDEHHWCQRCNHKEPHDWSYTTTETLERTEANPHGGGWKSVYGIYDVAVCNGCGGIQREKKAEREHTTPMPPD
jgi:hypothetical protein